jgi:hypothetical protein
VDDIQKQIDNVAIMPLGPRDVVVVETHNGVTREDLESVRGLIKEATDNPALVYPKGKMECSVLSYDRDDVIVFNIDVGQMPPQRCQQYIEQIRKELVGSKTFPKDQKMLFFAVRPGGRGSWVEVMKAE